MGKEIGMNDRQKEILSILYDSDGYVTVKNISNIVGYSVKTMRNDIKTLKEFLEENALGSIISKSNKGVCIKISEEDWKELNHLIRKKPEIKTFSEETKKQICEILLKKKRIQMKQLEEMFYISHSGIEKMVTQAQSWLVAQGVEVVRKRGQGLQINCDEYTWRIALWKLFKEIQLECNSFADKDNKQQIERFLDGFDSEGVRQAIKQMEHTYGIRYSYDAYQRLLFLLSIAVVENRRGKKVLVPFREKWEGEKYDRELANECSSILEQYYHMTIDSEEMNFICLAVGISEIQEFYDAEKKDEWKAANASIVMLTEKVVVLSEHIFQSELRKDEVFKEDLLLYLKATICQLKNLFHHDNPFIEQIKYRYPNIYVAAWSVSLLIESEAQVEFSEHEVAYLSLYLGGALERMNVNTEACIICNYGVGVSQILKEQIQRRIFNLDITDIFTTRDGNKIRKSNCDFIISTIPLESPYEGKEVIRIENILQERDINRIREKMKEVHKTKILRIAGKVDAKGYPLFQPFFVFDLSDEVSKEEILHFLCEELFRNGYVTKEFEDSVFEREGITSTALEKGLAIPHGTPQYVLRPIIGVAKLEVPIHWDDKNKVNLIFLLALNMGEKFGAKKQIIRFYSKLVTWMEEQEEFQELKNIEQPEKAAEFLNGLLAGGEE